MKSKKFEFIILSGSPDIVSRKQNKMGNKLSKTEEVRRLFISNTLLPSVIIGIILEYTDHENDCKECDRLTPRIIGKLRIGFNCSLDIDESQYSNHGWDILKAKYSVSVTERELVKIEYSRQENGWSGGGCRTLSADDFARQVVHGKSPSLIRSLSTAELREESHENEVRSSYDCKYENRFRRKLYFQIFQSLSVEIFPMLFKN
ncbi:MAG: hypothetical protein Hyperionvirus4_22 [Hyperionvirus sp.]|uniref:Uncharacterized protein n=1 Tax=Hyperionvirus sp. TaxID=2487770 RepID=A0A3G5A741_9VIRU|nr:MAG: hypothetical protein Hyperionvirus4_22 [Hyperionvirus sp.]